jgi:glycine betaine/proline transport system permease protein
VTTILTSPPWWVIVIIVAVIAWFSKKWVLAIGSAIGLVVTAMLGLWEHTMLTLSLVIVATVIALIISIPVGIWAAKSKRVSAVVKPIMDFLQTMPAFVYLIPMVIFFTVGPIPGIVATVIFSLAPGVRMTELGIRQVDPEVVEAGQAFGASPGRILRQIQLPLAMPTIMAGVNQVIMLALSMVVISGMVGGEGLGGDIVSAIQNVRIGEGTAAGLCVVILAIILDRITGGFGAKQRRKKKQPAAQS